MKTQVYFFFLSGALKGKIVPAPGPIVRIGRQPYCEVPLDPDQDIPASGDHAQVVVETDGTYTLHDLNSSWGTFKNDVRVTGPVPITTGDVITCGQDDTGQQGPRIKFYLEKDILRCKCCGGPVYKKHFKCPQCKKKVCLRCIDFKRKTCKTCGSQPAAPNAGYELVSNSGVQAKAPARVVVSGKDAQRARRALAKPKLQAPKLKVPGRGPHRSPKIKRDTKVLRKPGQGDDPGVVAEPVGAVDEPFCGVCRDFVQAKVFSCPVCKQTLCVKHKRGVVCPTCAGEEGSAAGGGSEPVIKVPDLSNLDIPDMGGIDSASARLRSQPVVMAEPDRPAAPAKPPVFTETDPTMPFPPPRMVSPFPGGQPGQSPPGHGAPAQRAPAPRGAPTPGFPAPAPPAPRSPFQAPPPRPAVPPRPAAPPRPTAPPPGSYRAPPPGVPQHAPPQHAPPAAQPLAPPPPPAGASPFLPPENKIEARRPAAIPCERCQAPLAARSFFVCERCRSRLCHRHRANATQCDACAPPAHPSLPRAPQAPSVPRAPQPPGAAAPYPPRPGPPAPPGGASGLPPPPPPLPGSPPRPVPGPAQRRPPAPARPGGRAGQDLVETVDDAVPSVWGQAAQTRSGEITDDDLARPAPGSAPPDGSGSGLGSVKFECPYCDLPLPAHARYCPHCRKNL